MVKGRITLRPGGLPPADVTLHAARVSDTPMPAPTAPTESAPIDYRPPWEQTEPRTRFQELYDEQAYQLAVTGCPYPFRAVEGRFDPFDKEYLELQVNGRNFSTFLRRRILYFDDALEHAKAISKFWADEDREYDERLQKEALEYEERLRRSMEARASRPTVVTPVEEARIAWKKAVSDRKIALEKWDIYVAEMHKRYKDARVRR